MAVSHQRGSVTRVREDNSTSAHRLISLTGHDFTRSVAFKFALDSTSGQRDQLRAFAGAARFTFNHHLAGVKANLAERSYEQEVDMASLDLKPSLSSLPLSAVA